LEDTFIEADLDFKCHNSISANVSDDLQTAFNRMNKILRKVTHGLDGRLTGAIGGFVSTFPEWQFWT
jgi:hypothetical protein